MTSPPKRDGVTRMQLHRNSAVLAVMWAVFLVLQFLLPTVFRPTASQKAPSRLTSVWLDVCPYHSKCYVFLPHLLFSTPRHKLSLTKCPGLVRAFRPNTFFFFFWCVLMTTPHPLPPVTPEATGLGLDCDITG